jgi:hypothetical protein
LVTAAVTMDEIKLFAYIYGEGGSPEQALELLQNHQAALAAAWGRGYVEGCRTASMSPERPVENWHGKATHHEH